MARLLLVLPRTMKSKIDLADVEVEEKNDLSYVKTPIKIFGQKEKDLKKQSISMVKVRMKRHGNWKIQKEENYLIASSKYTL